MLSFRPVRPGEYHVTRSSGVTNMRPFSFRRRTFLNPASTDSNSFIHAYIESVGDGTNKWGGNFLILADCRKRVEFEFCLGNRQHRRRSLAKINLLIEVLTAFREALVKEIALIEKRR
jgi:hypothetical protein